MDEVERLKEENQRLAQEVSDLKQLNQELAAVPPVDGWYGWVMVLCAFTAQFCVLGGINMFGVFIDDLQKDDELGSPSKTDVAWIVSLANFLTPVVGFFSGKLTDRFGPTPIMTMAGVALGAGLLLASWVQAYWELLLVFGCLLGLAGGCTITPGLATVGDWFSAKWRALAIGFVYAGSGMGTTLVPLLANWLLQEEKKSDSTSDWRAPFRYLALLSIPTLVAGLTIHKRNRHPPHLTGQGPGRNILQILQCRIALQLVMVGLLYAYGVFSVIVYIVPYAQAGGSHPYESRPLISDGRAAGLLSLFGAAQSVGCIAWGFLAAHGRNVACLQVSFLACAGLMAAWPFLYNYWMQALFAVAIGFFIAGCFTCYPTLAADHYAPHELGSVLGVIFVGFGTGSLIGPPVTGSLVEGPSHGSYWAAFWVCAAGFVAALLIVSFLHPATAAYELDSLSGSGGSPTSRGKDLSPRGCLSAPSGYGTVSTPQSTLRTADESRSSGGYTI